MGYRRYPREPSPAELRRRRDEEKWEADSKAYRAERSRLTDGLESVDFDTLRARGLTVPARSTWEPAASVMHADGSRGAYLYRVPGFGYLETDHGLFSHYFLSSSEAPERGERAERTEHARTTRSKDDVETILKLRGARQERGAYVTRGDPIQDSSGRHGDLDIPRSTEVFVDGRWQNLRQVLHESHGQLLDLRIRQHR